MKHIISLTLFLLSLCIIQAQDDFSKISLSGFKVNLIPSEKFSFEVKDSLEIETEVENDILEVIVIDQTGRVPKGEITVYYKSLTYLSLHNCQINIDVPMNSDSLELVTASSFGVFKINSDYFSVNIGAGSNLTIEGKTNLYDCAVGAGSTLQSSKLFAEKANINVMGYSNLSFNAKEVINSNIENSNVKNHYE